MIDDALKTSTRLIGMIQPHRVPGSDQDRLHHIGCSGRVTALSETDDGRYMITLSGMSRFRVGKEVSAFSPYRICEVSWAVFDRDQGPVEHDKGFDRDGFLDLLARYFEDQELSTDWANLKDAEDELLINSLSMLCPFDPEDKQALLEAPSLSTRRETLVTLIEFALRGGSNEELIQ